MAQLFVLSGPDAGKSFELHAGDRAGRSPECAITLKHPSISRQHAHFELEGGEWYVVDDGARNGVLVDKKRVPRAKLADMQEFQLGELLVRFRAGAAASAPVAAPSKPAPVPAASEDELVLEGDGELELEGEDEPAPPARSAPPPPPKPVEPTVTRFPAELVPTSISPRVPPPPTPVLQRTMLDTGFGRPPPSAAGAGDAISRTKRGPGDRVLQYHKIEQRGGLAHAELSQLSAPVKYALIAIAVIVMALVAWFAFMGTSFFKSRIGDPGAVDESTSEQ